MIHGVAAIAVSELAPALDHSPNAKSEGRGDLFLPRDWSPPKPAPEVISERPAAPTPPQMPCRMAGEVIHDGKLQVILAKGDGVLTLAWRRDNNFAGRTKHWRPSGAVPT